MTTVDLPRVLQESPISVAEVCLFPGAPKHPATIVKWLTRGVPVDGGGGVLRLEGVRMGHRWVTSREAVVRFFAELTADGLRGGVEAVASTPELASA
jgi:hypothetical protein